jgi:hypothetical protein
VRRSPRLGCRFVPLPLGAWSRGAKGGKPGQEGRGWARSPGSAPEHRASEPPQPLVPAPIPPGPAVRVPNHRASEPLPPLVPTPASRTRSPSLGAPGPLFLSPNPGSPLLGAPAPLVPASTPPAPVLRPGFITPGSPNRLAPQHRARAPDHRTSEPRRPQAPPSRARHSPAARVAAAGGAGAWLGVAVLLQGCSREGIEEAGGQSRPAQAAARPWQEQSQLHLARPL